jgi:low temperature requirement protein LtrA
MNESLIHDAAPRHGRPARARKMVARDPNEPHRVSTPLELLFDLCFVVAIAQASAHLHHGIAHEHFGAAFLGYGLVFFAIWWSWMNFTWFASAYDTDDVPYRLKVFVQILGALVIAAGVPRAFERRDFGVVTLGYVIARVGLIASWLRAASADPKHRRTALRFVAGLVLVQLGWLAVWGLPKAEWLMGWMVLAPAELLVPIWAERAEPTSWHPHHIAERFGLLTLIVLGESVLSATVAIQSTIDAAHTTPELYSVIAGSVLLMLGMWWLYFDREPHGAFTRDYSAFVWGYGHFAVFSSAAAVGAGIAVAVDFSVHHTAISTLQAGAAVALPAALYIAAVGWLRVRPLRLGPRAAASVALAIAIVLGAACTTWAVAIIGCAMAGLCAALRILPARGPRDEHAEGA